MKELYIHIGQPKTGTCALQEFLFLNQEKILDGGGYITLLRMNAKKTTAQATEMNWGC